MVVWQYLTTPPLYLVLCCLGWLYGLLILQHLPNQWYLVASLPGLFSVFAASRWLQQRQAATLAAVCYYVWIGATFALTAWSLFYAQPGLVATGTALVTMGFIFYGLQTAPTRLVSSKQTQEATPDLRNGPWLYSVTLLASIAIAYAPPALGLTWQTQSALGFIVLSLTWSSLGLKLSRSASQSTRARVEVLLNSAILNLFLSFLWIMSFVSSGITQHRAVPLMLAV